METRELLDRTDLAALLTELAGQPPTGHGRGTRWTCFAPDHRDENPSVSMFVDRRGIERWRCWSDGNGGTAIDAVMIARNVELPDAYEWLRHRAGDHEPRPPRTPTHTGPAEQRALSTALRRWVNDCEHRLWQPAAAGALEWLHDRGLDDAVLQANRIGYDPGHRQLARPDGLPRGRGITVCSFDPAGELAYAQTRNLHPTARSKYTNPTPRHGSCPQVTFPRGGPTDGPLLVTEGIFDGLAATQAGYRAAALISTAAVGGAGSAHTAAAIVEHARGAPIVLALDGDSAGRNATAQLRDQLRSLSAGADVHVLRLPDHHDLSSLRTRKDASCPAPNAQSARHRSSVSSSI